MHLILFRKKKDLREKIVDSKTAILNIELLYFLLHQVFIIVLILKSLFKDVISKNNDVNKA